MNEEKLLELLTPIKSYILNNELDRDDIRVVVANHFPSDDELAAIANYIKVNIPTAFKMIQSDKIIERTRQILQQALEVSAYLIWDEKYNRTETSQFTDEEINEEMNSEMMWEDEYLYGGEIEE